MSSSGAPSATGGADASGGATPTSDPNRGLVLYYDFDEMSGTVVHDRVNAANNGSVRGQAVWTGAGQIRGALKLAGGEGDAVNPQYVEIPPGPLRSLTQTTISAWIYWEGGWAWQRVFDFGADPDHCFFYTPDSGGAGQAIVRTMTGSNNVNLFITERPPLGQWMHLAVTWSSAAFAVYMDGQLMGSAPSGPSVPPPGVTPSSLGITPRNFIGRSQRSEDAYFEGAIDEFRVYDHALTAEEVRSLRDFRP
jgi:hypothetical protein